MNMIESAKAQVRQLTVAAYEKAAAAGLLPAGITAEPAVSVAAKQRFTSRRRSRGNASNRLGTGSMLMPRQPRS